MNFIPGTTALNINRQAKTVSLSNGQTIAYDLLVLALGARPVPLPLPGADLPQVITLRTFSDAEKLKNNLGPNRKVAIIGGGFVGLEVAASARRLGASAVIIERAERLLVRSASPAIADFYAAYHRSKSVDIILAQTVCRFEATHGMLSAVHLSNGQRIACDLAVTGVGVVPNTDIALAAGLTCSRGIEIDENGRTSDPDIFAIGDIVTRPSLRYGVMFCPESVHNAMELARRSACIITGRPLPQEEIPWNWSDQYDLKLQTAGMNKDIDDMVIRQAPDGDSFCVLHLCNGYLQQIEAVNAPMEFMMGRKLIAGRTLLDRNKISNPAFTIKDAILSPPLHEKT